MTVENIRYRVEGELVVLQVLDPEKRNVYHSMRDAEWRDAKVTDLLDVADLIARRGERVVLHGANTFTDPSFD